MKFRAILISLLLPILAANAFAGEGGAGAGRKDDVGEQKVERSVSVDAAVAVSLCVASGNISIHGWDRNEVRARSADAVKIELAHDPQSTPGASIKKLEVAVFNKDEAEKPAGKCQAFSDIELNVPRGATVLVQTRDGDISIAEVAAAYAGTQNGDIEVQKASRSIEIGSLAGNICLKDSSGRVNVSSAGGSVEAANLQPLQADDEFEVITTSGDIMLSHVTHKQINTKTVSGNLTMTGPLAPAGRYGFNSFSGDVTLAMPANSSFKLVAKVSQDGEIITDFPLTLTQTSASAAAEANAVATAEATAAPVAPAAKSGPVSPVSKVAPVVRVDVKPKIHVKVKPEVKFAFSMRRVNGIHGTGDAMISVSSFLGTLRLEQN
ncbi:MAG: DUF4097 domain-containing protein [Acidobacteriota bacterium]|nr:DUF4097 domain-containing protein [Acidobacteriota bacterium]